MSGPERRSEARFPIEMSVVLTHRGIPMEATAKDVSLNGMGLYIEGTPELRTRDLIEIRFTPSGRKEAVLRHGKVRWIGGVNGERVGVRFSESLDPADLKPWW